MATAESMSDSVPTAAAESQLSKMALAVKQLGKFSAEVVITLGKFIDDIWKKSTVFAEIANKVHRINSMLAMEFENFSLDLSKLRDYYTTIYRMTKAMVKFGMDEEVIPYIISLIQDRKYQQAFKEIKSFLYNLSERINKIVEKLDKHEENNTIMSKRLQNLNSKHEEAKKDLDELVKEEKKTVYYQLGKNTVFCTLGATGIFLIGKQLGVAQVRLDPKLDPSQNALDVGNEVISFVTEQGIQTLQEIASTSAAFSALTVTIEQNAMSTRDVIHNFHSTLNKFHSQISCIITNINQLKEYDEGLHVQLRGIEPKMDNSFIEWQNIKITLNEEMLDIFKDLQKQVVEKEISWTQL